MIKKLWFVLALLLLPPGVWADERYMIGPYKHYRTEEDLLVFDSCANDKKIPAARYYECFVFDDESGQLTADLHNKPRRSAGRKSR